MILVSLIAEGFHFEIPKVYIYFFMAFAFLVDVMQMKKVEQGVRLGAVSTWLKWKNT